MTTMLAVILASYVVGAIPFGFAVGKYWCRVDIRTLGSGNIGAANAFRVLGPVPGTVVLLLDAAKGAIPLLLVGLRWHGEPWGEILQVGAGLAAILGHNYSCFLGWKGGKGIATSAGVFLVLSWKALLVALAVWVIAVALTRYSSVGSILAAVVLPLALWRSGAPLPHLLFALLAALFAVYKHRENIRRLLRRQENRLF